VGEPSAPVLELFRLPPVVPPPHGTGRHPAGGQVQGVLPSMLAEAGETGTEAGRLAQATARPRTCWGSSQERAAGYFPSPPPNQRIQEAKQWDTLAEQRGEQNIEFEAGETGFIDVVHELLEGVKLPERVSRH
jgi:hypothetical protein